MLFSALIITFLTVIVYGTANVVPHSVENVQLSEKPRSEHTPTLGTFHAMLKRQHYTDLNYTGPTYQAYNFSMPIDHFNTSDNRTYQNRYWINDTYYKAGGPVIWYDRGEGGVTDAVVDRYFGEVNGTTALMALARQYHGLALIWELRYFGYSLPFPLNITNGTSYREPIGAPATWKYNTFDQGLEDAAYFANRIGEGQYQRDNMTALLPQNTPWIFLGGSFPGVRAATVRVRSPETFYAAWASSAPVQGMYDGSSLYDGPEMSLYPNCSVDVKATIRYTDEVLSGAHGPDAYSHLQHLSYAASFYNSYSYNASQATFFSPASIASSMATPFTGTFFNAGPVNTTWLFCDAFESFNPNATGSNTNDTYLSIVTNPRNALPSDDGFLATHQNNLTLTLEAYFSAYVAYSNFMIDYLALQRTKVHQIPDGQADGTAWDYIANTQFGWFSGSNPANTSIVSKFNNVTFLKQGREPYSFSNATRATLPERPDVAAWNKYGGWRMNPSNVMFTDGAVDPWRAGSVFSLDTQNGAPGLRPSEEVPMCGAPLSDSNTRFGILYPDAAHVPDLEANEEVYGTGPDAPFARGMALFTRALDVWLPCFGTTSNSTML